MTKALFARFGSKAEHATRGLLQREYSVPLISFTAFALLYTHPLATSLSRIAARGNDFLLFLWNFWWVRESVEQLQSPLFTDYQYHPSGTSLALHPTSYHWAYLSVPLQYFMPRQVVLNVFYIVSFVATGMATFYLLRYLKNSKGAAFLGSFVFAFCIHRIDRFHFYEIHLLGTMYMPLFMYYFLRIYELAMIGQRHRALKQGALAGIALALTTLCSWYYGVFLIIFCIFLFVHKTLHCWNLPLKALALMVLVFLLAVGPFVLPTFSEIREGHFPPRSYEYVLRSSEHNSADLLGYVVPNRATPGVGLAVLQKLGFGRPLTRVEKITASYHGNSSEKGVFPGYTVLLLVILSIFTTARTKDRSARGLLLFLYAAAVSFALLSLGPTLYVRGEPTVSLVPYRLLMEIPVLNITRAPSRFVIMVMLCLAIIAAATLDHFRRLIKRKAVDRLLIAVLLALLIAETLPFRPHPLRPVAEVQSQFFFELAKEPDKELVLLNVPVDFKGARGGGGLYLYHQTIHRQRIVGGYLGREPVYVLRQLESSPFLKALHHRAYSREKRISLEGFSDREVARSLANLEVDCVVLYKKFLGEYFSDVDSRFGRVLGARIFEDALVKVYWAGDQTDAPSNSP